jgi:hypothetical protein
MPLEIPPEFQYIPYDAERYPRSAESDFRQGANCQLWAFALLRHFGIEVPSFRSSELWEDKEFSDTVRGLEPLDLLLFNDTDNAWGAHVAVYLGDDVLAHLSRQVGLPEVRAMEDMLRTPKYQVLVGAKRIRSQDRAMQATRPNAVAVNLQC